MAAGASSTRYVLDGAGHGDLSFLGDSKSGLPWSTKQAMGIIVDFLCEPPWIPGLLAVCLQFFRAERMSTVCCLHRNPVSTAAFAALGFARRDTGWPFLAKPRSVSAAGLALVRDPGNWFLTGADSDLDRPRPEDVSARRARASG